MPHRRSYRVLLIALQEAMHETGQTEHVRLSPT